MAQSLFFTATVGDILGHAPHADDAAIGIQNGNTPAMKDADPAIGRINRASYSKGRAWAIALWNSPLRFRDRLGAGVSKILEIGRVSARGQAEKTVALIGPKAGLRSFEIPLPTSEIGEFFGLGQEGLAVAELVLNRLRSVISCDMPMIATGLPASS